MSADTHFDRETMPVRPCDKCGWPKVDVRLDRHSGERLCNRCWVETRPPGPPPRRERLR